MRSAFSQIRRPQPKDTPLTYEERLRLDLKLAKWELDCAYAGFDYATDPDLIDCYIFKLNAAMKRYKFLLECYNSLQTASCSKSGEAVFAGHITLHSNTAAPNPGNVKEI